MILAVTAYARTDGSREAPDERDTTVRCLPGLSLADPALRRDEVHDRQTLAFLFWPDPTDSQIRINPFNAVMLPEDAPPRDS